MFKNKIYHFFSEHDKPILKVLLTVGNSSNLSTKYI